MAFVLMLHATGNAQAWTPLPIPLGVVSDMTLDPHHPGMVYICYRGVIAGTSDGGETWIYKPFSDYTNQWPRDLLIDCVDSMRWYMAMDEAGFMLSTDAGRTWRFNCEDLDIRDGNDYKQLVQDPVHPNILYLVCKHYVYKSTDRGEQWRSVFSQYGRYKQTSALIMNQRHPDSLYVFGYGDDNDPDLTRRWVSADRGEHWSRDSSRFCNLTTHTITSDGKLMVGSRFSEDYGKTWVEYKRLYGIKDSLRIYANYQCRTIYNPLEDVYLIGASNGVYSRNPGEEEWKPTSFVWDEEETLGAPQLYFIDKGMYTIWGWHDGKVIKSTDGGLSFQYIETGPYLASTNFITTHDPKGGMIVGEGFGTMDNGASWKYQYVTDGENVISCGAISPIDSLFMLQGTITNMLYTKTGWTLFGDSASGWVLPAIRWCLPCEKVIHFNPHNPHEVFGGGPPGLWRVTDSTIFNTTEYPYRWKFFITPEGPNYQYISFAFHPWYDGVYFLCSGENQQYSGPLCTVWKSTDYGVSWTPILDHHSTYYADICVNPVDPDIIIVASHSGILRTTDGGKNWSQDYGLPFRSAFLNDILIDPSFPNVYYCGAMSVNGNWTHPETGKRSGGMYISYDYGATWETMPLDGMHNVSVRRIHYHENPRRLIVSTWAGIYETILPEMMSSAPALPEHAELTVSVYPNPVTASRMHRIVIDGTHGNDVLVDLYSVIGSRLAQLHDGPLAPKQILKNDVSGLSPGLYYYRVHAGHAWKTIPVMIQR